MARKTFADHLVSLRQPLELASPDTQGEVLDEIAFRFFRLSWEDLSPAQRRQCTDHIGIDDPSVSHEDDDVVMPLDMLIR